MDGFKKMHQPSRAVGMPISATKSTRTGRQELRETYYVAWGPGSTIGLGPSNRLA